MPPTREPCVNRSHDRYATLMREVTRNHDGAFPALPVEGGRQVVGVPDAKRRIVFAGVEPSGSPQQLLDGVCRGHHAVRDQRQRRAYRELMIRG